MASKQISPAAELLRHSKLFALPDPIQRPPTVTRGVVATRRSDTATLNYPTRAAIITTNKGRKQGDWGMKRNLPLHKTATRNNPIFQIRAVDSIDHITDYEFGTPHAISLRKFQEMNMPIMQSEFSGTEILSRAAGKFKSVFDMYEPKPRSSSTVDSTKESLASTERWKFSGPWLAGMDELAFEDYLQKKVQPRRAEFKKYLRKWMLKTKKEKLRSQQLAAGVGIDDQEVALDDGEYETMLAQLRHERRQLFILMWEFLDLPGRSPEEQSNQSKRPPVTHPSAGLSYLKTSSILSNHPALGAMQEHQPVPARVLRQSSDTRNGHATNKATVVGIAGFVSDASRGLFGTPQGRDSGKEYGNEKMYVLPRDARIDEMGRTKITWNRADKHSVAIWDAEYDAKAHERAELEAQNILQHSDGKKFAMRKLFNSGRLF